MRLSAILFGLIFTFAAVSVAVPPQDGEDVRGAFLTSRPKEKPATSSSAAKPSRRRPKATATAVKPPEKTTGTSAGSTAGSTAKSNPPESRPVNVPRLGLGLTLFSRDSNGLAVRVDPDRVFRKGDRVRVLLETNADGYLYIRTRTNKVPPVMINPDAENDEGRNY